MKTRHISRKIGKANLRFVFALAPAFILLSCEQFIEIDPPRTDLIKSTVFESDATANAAMIDIYYDMKASGFASGNPSSISLWGTLSSDEQINYATSSYQQFNDNELTPDNSFIFSLWSQMYATIFSANAIIDGIGKSRNVTPKLKLQLEGEAKFVRAFCHFYLINLFGDVPLVTSVDYRTNTNIARIPVNEVYEALLHDLKDAQSLLPADFSFSDGERTRINKHAATAMLARVYLYLGDWAKAEAEATRVITTTDLFSLQSNLADVFLTNSSEAILQWWSATRPNDLSTFRVQSSPIYGALRPDFVNSFQFDDIRSTTWIGVNSRGYFFTRKYTSSQSNPPLQYSTVLRLAEQYLIRAEARAQQDNISGAQADINVIRNRAILGNTAANDREALLLAIEEERKFELFTEWGHRWFDLKRTARAEAILAPIKGTNWDATDVLYPIPQAQIMNDPAMKDAQNPGY